MAVRREEFSPKGDKRNFYTAPGDGEWRVSIIRPGFPMVLSTQSGSWWIMSLPPTDRWIVECSTRKCGVGVELFTDACNAPDYTV